MRNFMELLRARWQMGKFLCVGLDSNISAVGPLMGHDSLDLNPQHVYSFNKMVVDAVAPFVCAFKPNRAFYADKHRGHEVLEWTIRYIHIQYPDIPVILDAKVADIDNTNVGYVREAFQLYDADAITVHPYLGAEALTPFLALENKGIIVLCRTSNKGSGELQNLWVSSGPMLDDMPKMPLYEYVAHRVNAVWNSKGNCAVVVGATFPYELSQVRSIVGNMPILIPGIGAQGGDVEATVRAGQDENGEGMIINASRSVIFAGKTREEIGPAAAAEAKRLHDLINHFRRVR